MTPRASPGPACAVVSSQIHHADTMLPSSRSIAAMASAAHELFDLEAQTSISGA